MTGGRIGRRASAGSIALAVATGWNVANIGALAHTVSHAYGISLAAVGLFTTALFVVHALMQVPSGRLADRFGPRRVALLGLAALALPNAVALVEPATPLAIAMRLATGIGTALCFVSGSEYVRSSGGGALGQGIYGGAAGAASGLALAIVPEAAVAVGWRAPYLTAVAAAVVAAGFMLAAPRERRRPRPERRPDAGRLAGDTLLLRLGLLQGVSFGLSAVIGNWVVTLLERTGGYSTGVAGAIGALTFLPTIVARPLGGWIARSHPSRAALVVAGSCVVGGAATAGLLVPRPIAAAIVSTLFVGLAAGIPFAYVVTSAAASRPHAPAAAIGFVNMGAAAVIVVGTPLLGLAFSGPWGGRLGFVVVASIWAGSIALLPFR